MVYGYDVEIMNEYGLRRMSEISLAASPASLRELAAFLLLAADEAENAVSEHWHKHAPSSVRDGLECDFVVLKPSLE
jgi:hypothetical protein